MFFSMFGWIWMVNIYPDWLYPKNRIVVLSIPHLPRLVLSSMNHSFYLIYNVCHYLTFSNAMASSINNESTLSFFFFNPLYFSLAFLSCVFICHAKTLNKTTKVILKQPIILNMRIVKIPPTAHTYKSALTNVKFSGEKNDYGKWFLP